MNQPADSSQRNGRRQSHFFFEVRVDETRVCLAWFDTLDWHFANPLIVFGRVPFFYFLIHFFAAHAIASVMEAIRYARPSIMFGPFPNMGGRKAAFPPDFGFDLWVVDVVWFSLVLALYPLCRWFACVKARHHDWWLSYL